MSAIALEPCPFCGSEAEIERVGDHSRSTIYQCTSCGCSLETGEEWDHGRGWNERVCPTDGVGWVFLNEGAGEEYAPNHPIESGEVPDAKRIRRSTAHEDVLWNAFQGEFQRAHALETATPSQRLDAATVERDAADARRYRYLRDHCSYHEGMTWDQPAEWSIGWEFQQSTPAQAYGTFDGLIDADIERRLAEEARDAADDAALATEPHQHGGKGA